MDGRAAHALLSTAVPAAVKASLANGAAGPAGPAGLAARARGAAEGAIGKDAPRAAVEFGLVARWLGSGKSPRLFMVGFSGAGGSWVAEEMVGWSQMLGLFCFGTHNKRNYVCFLLVCVCVSKKTHPTHIVP